MTTSNQNNSVGRTVGPRRRPQTPSGPARTPARQQVTAPQPFVPSTPQPAFRQSLTPQPAPQTCTPAPVPYPQAAVPQAPEKSWTTALLLVIFLGSFGAHNFYLGYRTRAWWQLGLMVFGLITSLIFIGVLFTIPVGIWVFVDFIRIATRSGMYRHDADGRPLR